MEAKWFRVLTVCAGVVLAGSAAAVAVDPVVVEPDDYPANTVLNDACPGVTLTALGDYSGRDGNVYARISSITSTGSQVFGSSWGISFIEWGFDSSFQPHLRVDFDSLVMWVAVDAIGNNSEDYGRMEVYDAGGTLLGSFETAMLSVGDVETMAFSTPSPSIGYVLLGGKDPGTVPHHTVCLDNLQYVVPEPATLSLLTVCAVVLIRRKRPGLARRA